MWKCAVIKAVSNALTIHVLLTHTSNHLSNVQHVTLGSRLDHVDHAILFVIDLGQTEFTCLFTGFIQKFIDFSLKVLVVTVDRLILKLTHVYILDNVRHLHLHILNNLGETFTGICIHHEIRNTHTETRLDQPVTDEPLCIVEELTGFILATIVVDGVDKTLGPVLVDFLINDTLLDLTVFDHHKVVLGVGLAFFVRIICTSHVDVGGND